MSRILVHSTAPSRLADIFKLGVVQASHMGIPVACTKMTSKDDHARLTGHHHSDDVISFSSDLYYRRGSKLSTTLVFDREALHAHLQGRGYGLTTVQYAPHPNAPVRARSALGQHLVSEPYRREDPLVGVRWKQGQGMPGRPSWKVAGTRERAVSNRTFEHEREVVTTANAIPLTHARAVLVHAPEWFTWSDQPHIHATWDAISDVHRMLAHHAKQTGVRLPHYAVFGSHHHAAEFAHFARMTPGINTAHAPAGLLVVSQKELNDQSSARMKKRTEIAQRLRRHMPWFAGYDNY